MKLIDYMRTHSLDDEAMAALVGGITSHGIRKLKYHERNPSLEVAIRIEAVTNGQVRALDLMKPDEQSSRPASLGAAAAEVA